MALDGGGFSAACRRALAVIARHPSQFICSEIIVGAVSLLTYVAVILLAFELSIRTAPAGNQLTHRKLFGLGETAWDLAGLSHDESKDDLDHTGKVSGASAAATGGGDGPTVAGLPMEEKDKTNGWEAEETTTKEQFSTPERKLKKARTSDDVE